MTTKEARKILGSLANDLTDEEIEKDIKTAEILKNLFFSQYQRPYKEIIINKHG